MDKINELKQQVTAIEATASDTMPKDELYDLLVVAYNHLKDIIVLQDGNIPLVKDNATETALRDAKATIATLEVGLEVANGEIARLKDTNLDLSNYSLKAEATFADISVLINAV